MPSPRRELLRQDNTVFVQGGCLGRRPAALPSKGRGGEADRPAQERAGTAAITHSEYLLAAQAAVHLLHGVPAGDWMMTEVTKKAKMPLEKLKFPVPVGVDT